MNNINSIPTAHQLAIQVQTMRKAQVLYFEQIAKARKSNLPDGYAMANAIKAQAKSLEKKADEMVETILLADPNEANRLEQIHLLIHQVQRKIDGFVLGFRPATFSEIQKLLQQTHDIAAGKEVQHG